MFRLVHRQLNEVSKKILGFCVLSCFFGLGVSSFLKSNRSFWNFAQCEREDILVRGWGTYASRGPLLEVVLFVIIGNICLHI